MRPRARSCALALTLACASGLAVAAPGVASADETNAAGAAAARRHFEAGRALYAQGSYREARTELEAAHAIDPSAKDLVFNLGVVSEKLGDIDEALRWFRTYVTMALTDAERERSTATIRRLEGAKKELDDKAAEARAAGEKGASGTPAPARSAQPGEAAAPAVQRGRLDWATWTAAGVAGAGLVLGAVMGAVALHEQPSSAFVTGRDGSYADLASQADSAHRAAVLADVGFGVGIAAGAAAVALYFGRPRAGAPRSAPASASVSGALAPGHVALAVGGTF